MVSEFWVSFMEQILRFATLGTNDVEYASILQKSFVVCCGDSTDQDLSTVPRVLRNHIWQVLFLNVRESFFADLILH